MATWKTAREFILGPDVIKALETVEQQAAERAALIDDLVRPTLTKKKAAPVYRKRTGPLIDNVRQEAAPRKRTRLL